MKYSKRQIEVWQARARLSEKLSHMTPEEITAYARKVAEQWRRKTEAESPSTEPTRPPAETPQS
jgi:hypothetical protein